MEQKKIMEVFKRLEKASTTEFPELNIREGNQTRNALVATQIIQEIDNLLEPIRDRLHRMEADITTLSLTRQRSRA